MKVGRSRKTWDFLDQGQEEDYTLRMSKANTFVMNSFFNAIDAWIEGVLKSITGGK